VNIGVDRWTGAMWLKNPQVPLSLQSVVRLYSAAEISC
jgi:hypothetical protein